MKRLSFFLIILLLLLATPASTFAYQTSTTSEITYYPDGSYVITIIPDTLNSISTTSTTVTKSKTSTYYSNTNQKLWNVKVTGTFTYGNGSAKCLSATVYSRSYNSSWIITKTSSSHNNATATATAIAVQEQNNTPVQTIVKSVSLTCRPDGSFY